MYCLQILIVLSGTTLGLYFLGLQQLIVPTTLGAIATALTDFDDRLSIRLRNLAYVCILFFSVSSILDFLHLHPADNSSLQQLAVQHNMTERTLARYSQKELGMSLNEWRQRLKVMKAMSMLTEGKKVESIALDLGYANASAFINMFKRWMVYTPDQFRKLYHSHQ